MTREHLVHFGGLVGAGAALCFFAAGGPHAFDTGELVAAAFVLGGSHPPGQPLHTLLGFAATLLPFGPAAFRVTLVSVAGALGVAAVAGAMAVRLAKAVSTDELRRPLLLLLALVAGFASLVSPPVMRQATRPEVYTVALALFGLSTLALLDWSEQTDHRGRPLYIAALCGGLAASLHPPHGLSAVLVGLVLMVSCRRDVRAHLRALGFAAAFFMLGFAPLTLLPIRAYAGAPMWGDPTTFAGFWAYVSAAAYRQNLGAAGGSVAEQILTVVRYVPYAAGIVPLFGLLALARKSRQNVQRKHLVVGASSAAGVALAGALVTPIDEAIPDMIAYAGPAVLLVIAFGAAGLATLPRLPYAVVGLVGVAASVFALRDAPAALDADAPALEALGQSLVATPPTRSLVVVTEDFAASTWTMERAVADARPDVAVFVSGLATSSWHWKSLRPHPAFDGEPLALPGHDPWQRYTRGAMQHAAGKVPISVEVDEWSGGLGVLAGAYLIGDPRYHSAVLDGSSGERLSAAVAALAAEGPAGDHDVVHAIYRGYETRRAHRLSLRRQTDRAMQSLARALIDPDAFELEALGEGTLVVDPARLSPVVEGPRALGVSRAATIRHAAVILSASGGTNGAVDLLERQRPQDPRAILQVGLIALAGGDRDVATRALAEFEAAAPELDADAQLLSQRLEP